MSKFANFAGYIFSWAGIWSLILLIGFAFHVWVVFGHWPSYNNPDPSRAPFGVFYWSAVVALVVIHVVGHIYVGCVALSNRFFNTQVKLARLVSPLLLADVIIFALVRYGIGGIVEWFVD